MEENTYIGIDSGFSMQNIDGLLLAVYRYTPMSGSSYVSLPEFIVNK